jgi:rhodanese-related sulfurtransferase
MTTKIPIIKINELKELLSNEKENFTLIDVRTSMECQDNMIPKAKNIVLNDVEKAFNLDGDKFKNTYGFNKPDYNDKIIFYCRSGQRSNMAAEIIKDLGYEK